jgi:hypothetical protein
VVAAKNRCAKIGCSRNVYRALAIAPGMVVDLCAEYYSQEQNDLESQKAA